MLVTIARFSFPYEAHIARGRLLSAGIPAWVADEHLVGMQWLYSQAVGGVRLQVSQMDVAEASAILQEDGLGELIAQQDVEPTLCPQCCSPDVEIKRKGRGPAFLMMYTLGFAFWPVDELICCRSCGKNSIYYYSDKGKPPTS